MAGGFVVSADAILARCCHSGAMRRHLLTAVAVLALAGCGSTAKPAAGPPATPSPTVSTATITTYASRLNGPLKDYRDAWKKYEDTCLIDDSDPICGVLLLTVNLSAKNVALSIHGAEDASSHVYAGKPPAEIAQLVADTLTAAGTVDTETGDADHLPNGWAADANRLDGLVDAWGPYLGG